MLYIEETEPSKFTGNKVQNWHIGETKPTVNPVNVVLVQADGDELNYIISRFVNIPFTTGRVQIWRGEFARFITENL